jgi:protein SDA1
VIATFQLDFDQFFNWSSRFIRPSYDEITKLLSIVASAVHPLTTPDTLTELLRTIADRFIADHLDEEVMIVGMNTVREICAKNPHGMTEDLLGDLVQYKKSTVKGVVMAARGLIQLFRDVMPDILPKKDRGKGTDDGNQPALFGEVKAAVPPADSLDEEQPPAEASLEVTEDALLEGSRVHKRTREERLEASREGKPEHGFRSRMADKVAGFSNKEKLKNKPFMLTRFRKDAGHMKLRSLNAIQKDQKRREGIQKSKMS